MSAPDHTTDTPPNLSEDWTVESTFENGQPSVGDKITFSKPITTEEVHEFAGVSGDTNPLHLNDDYAADTQFGEPIVHGMLLTGLVSAALARIPGRVVYLTQNIEFKNPGYPDGEFTAVCELIENNSNDTYTVETTVTQNSREILTGTAVILIQ